MRTRKGLAAGAAMACALVAASCGGGETGEAPEAGIDANRMLETPGNDASALESAIGPPEAAPLPPGANPIEPADAPDGGEDEGGDTGGNTLDSDVAGM